MPEGEAQPPVARRERVLELRRSHSLAEVARLAGLPLGTVKTMCSRSVVFRGNVALRELFTLPPIEASSCSISTAQMVSSCGAESQRCPIRSH